MSNESSTAASGGTSIVGLLGIVFVVLKLTGVINWSWWLVLLPFYGGLALFLGFLLVVAIFGGAAFGVASLLDKRDNKKRLKVR